ncbi:Cryptochrome DASH, chloroplastic/mitochondrial [Vitis vinifera]|uniref:Cryptochrome DASH, chloroplastic/mitochondrial n=1 Tax=Vitis vinifera TaxID=29760 RepID=A0A438K7X3_VITVI|nr:Cryptochrome DASH, chloroplastic/mitochondrial [Vitis vinifera]
MAVLSSSLSAFFIKKLVHPSKPTSIFSHYSTHPHLSAMNFPPRSKPGSAASATTSEVPDLPSNEMGKIVEQTFQRYSSSDEAKRNGSGVAIVWFRNDLRFWIMRLWSKLGLLLRLCCLCTVLIQGFLAPPITLGSLKLELPTPPIWFRAENSLNFHYLAALRAQFLIECLADLKRNLMNRGLNLLIQHGKPEEILPSLAKTFEAHTVYAHKETCSEELNVERLVRNGLRQVVLPPSPGQSTSLSSSNHPKLQLIWGSTMYHIEDLPFSTSSLPDVYTQFRKSVESKCTIRICIRTPTLLGPPPNIEDWGSVPSIDQLGLHEEKAGLYMHPCSGMRFIGGEAAALSRDLLKVYKATRNGMLGADYSTKFSPWLASGSLSPRFIYQEVKRYEKERQANDSTYWVLFELIWRDYFRFLSVKYRNSLFHLGKEKKPKKLQKKEEQHPHLPRSFTMKDEMINRLPTLLA